MGRILLGLLVVFLLSFSATIRGQDDGVQIDVRGIFQAGLPILREVRSLLRAESQFDARKYRRLRNALRDGDYGSASSLLDEVERNGGDGVDAAVGRLRALLAESGVDLFRGPQTDTNTPPAQENPVVGDQSPPSPVQEPTGQADAQSDTSPLYQASLPLLRDIRSSLRSENQFNARTYRRLRNALRDENYERASIILEDIENVGGADADSAVQKLRTMLGNGGIALFQNAQADDQVPVAQEEPAREAPVAQEPAEEDSIAQEDIQYRLGEFGIYDSNGNLIIKTGALDTPKRLAYLLDNPIKLAGFSSSEKNYIQNEYDWTEDPSALLTVLTMADLRNYPRYGNEQRPKSSFSHPYVIRIKNPIIDFIGFRIRTSPSRSRQEAIDKMFAWLTSPSPDIGRDRMYPRGGSAAGALRACLNQNYTRLGLSPINDVRSSGSSGINEMRSSNTASIDLVDDLKTYLNSDNPYASFYFVRAAQILHNRYRKRQNNAQPAFTYLNDPAQQVKDARNHCYDQKTDTMKPLYGPIKTAFGFQAFSAIIKDIADDSGVFDIMADLVREDHGKTEIERLSEVHDTVSFDFNFRDPNRGYRIDPNICYSSKSGPKINIPYTKRWLLGMLVDRYILQIAYTRDWISVNYDWFDEVEREYNYALWRRRPLIDYATHSRTSEFSVLWSSGYCFPTDDFKDVDGDGKGGGLASSIAIYNNLYHFIGEDLDRVK